MKTHVIKDDGTVTVIEGRVKELKEMQALVKGPIEIVNAAMPAASAALPGGKKLKEMIAEGLCTQLDNIQDIRGDVFVTDGWRIA